MFVTKIRRLWLEISAAIFFVVALVYQICAAIGNWNFDFFSAGQQFEGGLSCVIWLSLLSYVPGAIFLSRNRFVLLFLCAGLAALNGFSNKNPVVICTLWIVNCIVLLLFVFFAS